MAGASDRPRRHSASTSPAAAAASGYGRAAPVRVYPPPPTRALQALQSVSAPVAVVGVLGASLAVAGAFTNRIIGRRAFHVDDAEDTEAQRRSPAVATIQAYYDATKRCLYLLGVCHSFPIVVTGEQDGTLPPALAELERERLRMQTLLLSSCHLVFVLKRNARTTTSDLKLVRSIAAEKAQLLQQMSSNTSGSGGGKGNKRDSSSGRNSSSSSSTTSSHVLAPGKCIPVAVFVVPAPSDSMLTASVKSRAATGSSAPNASRSATVTFCKSIETRLVALFRSVRGGPVGSARLRDALSAATLSKERRVFTLDPSHSVVMVSRRAMLVDSAEERLMEVLDLADCSTDSGSELDDLDTALDELLAPLEDDDVGFSRAVQYQQRVIDHLLSPPGSSNKDAAGGRVEVLPLGQWLRSFIALAKSQDRMDERRRSSVTSIDTTER